MNCKLLLPCLASALLFGCASNNNSSSAYPVHGVAPATAAKLDAAHSSFDAQKDPPFNVSTRIAAGQLAEVQGAPESAIAQYKEALKIDPNCSPALFRLGVLYTEQKQFTLAIDDWKKYQKVTKNSAASYSDMGYTLEMAGQNHEAEDTYKKGIAADPKCEVCRVNYGLMLARHGRVDEAILQLQTVLTPAEMHYDIASIYELQNRRELAKEEFRRSIDADPAFSDAKMRLAKLDE